VATEPTSNTARHLVLGATGVAGDGIARHLAETTDEPVFALSRRGSVPVGYEARIDGVACDLLDEAGLATQLETLAPTRVYYAAHAHPAGNAGDLNPRTMQRMLRMASPFSRVWDALPGIGDGVYGLIGRRAGIVDNGRNAAMFGALVRALRGPAAATVRHLAVLTGGRLYGVHLGPNLYPGYPGRLAEDSPRHPGPSWYFAIEDLAFDLASEGQIGVSLHRPHFILGAVRGAPYSLINGLGVYAALCREAGVPLRFLGGRAVYEARFEAASSEQIAAQMAWAACTPEARGEAFNVTNGEPLRWPEVWPALAARFGLEAEVSEQAMHLREVVADPEATWKALRERAGLVPMPLGAAFPQAFLHQSMVMTWDVHYDIGKAERMGFSERRAQVDEVLRLIDRLVVDGTLPPLPAPPAGVAAD
jgi:nucleoside-diphosphate-sugar epimerase